MEPIWTIVTIIASSAGATGLVLGIYFNHKGKTEERVKTLEEKIQHHEKFITILEKKALKAMEDEFNSNSGKDD